MKKIILFVSLFGIISSCAPKNMIQPIPAKENKVHSIRMAKCIGRCNPKKIIPLNKLEWATLMQFSSKEEYILVIMFADLLKGTNVEAHWFYERRDLRTFLPVGRSHSKIQVSHKGRQVQFVLSMKGKGFAHGKYRVEIYINDNHYETFDFEVTE